MLVAHIIYQVELEHTNYSDMISNVELGENFPVY